MENCKALTLWLKALNKHRITHIMYIEMENVISKKKEEEKKEEEKLTHDNIRTPIKEKV